MKSKIQALYTLLALFAASCAVEPSETTLPEETREETAVSHTPVQMTFSATFGDNETATKTSINPTDGQISWKAGESIQVFNGTKSATFTSTNTETGTRVDFTGSIEAPDDALGYWGVYPVNENNAGSADAASVTATLPVNQTAVEGTFADNIQLSVAKSTDGKTFKFYNVCSGYMFSVQQEGVTAVTLKGNNGEIVAGTVKVTLGEDNIPSWTAISGKGATSVTLSAPEGQTFQVGKFYFLMVLPQTFEKGFTMQFDTETQSGAYNRTTSVEFKRAIIKRSTSRDKDVEYGHKYVDLGLSVVWADCNLGAEKPEDIGDLYAWGELDVKENYSWTTYKWCNGTEKTLLKYNPYGTSYGTVDGMRMLTQFDDVARAKLGSTWRIPSKNELNELNNQCTWTWTKRNGVPGYEVKSNSNGNSIFFPVSPYMNGQTPKEGNVGYYWLRELSSYITSSIGGPSVAQCLSFNETTIDSTPNSTIVLPRAFGLAIRPVLEKPVAVTGISLNATSITLVAGQRYQLKPNISPYNATEASVTWTSENPSFASVDETGLVRAKKEGTTTVTVTTLDGNKTATCTVKVLPIEEVDLGLSVNWAAWNLGAAAPEEYGYYFAYGAVDPYAVKPVDWRTGYSDWQDYLWCNGDNHKLTKYCSRSDYGNNGFTDALTQLLPEDDAASYATDGAWRMPTIEEIRELIDNCTWEWTTYSGINGNLCTSKKNGKTVFFPAAGYYRDMSLVNTDTGSTPDSIYRSSDLNIEYPSESHNLRLNNQTAPHTWENSRAGGYSIRPVCSK